MLDFMNKIKLFKISIYNDIDIRYQYIYNDIDIRACFRVWVFRHTFMKYPLGFLKNFKTKKWNQQNRLVWSAC